MTYGKIFQRSQVDSSIWARGLKFLRLGNIKGLLYIALSVKLEQYKVFGFGSIYGENSSVGLAIGTFIAFTKKSSPIVNNIGGESK